MMIYRCKRCHFEFERMATDVEECPGCGKKYCVRAATPAEIEQFEKCKRAMDQQDIQTDKAHDHE